MFYHENTDIIDTPSSYLDPRQVFTGNYWDEFGFTPYLAPDNAKVLMLGLASGGGLRSLFSSTKKLQLQCVDVDAKSLDQCRRFFAQKFPHIYFETECVEAKSYLRNSDTSYDLIWLDIYAYDSYSELYFDKEFLNLLKLHLKPSGVLMVNTYGIPTQFAPLLTNSVQRESARLLKQQFEFVGSIPNRRNQTLVASRTKPVLQMCEPHQELSALDKRSFLLQGARLRHLRVIPELIELPLDLALETKFTVLDQHMRNGWRNLIQTLRFYDVNIESPKDLLQFVQDPQQCTAFLTKALSVKDGSVLEFLPIVCAGESHVHKLNVSWIFDWVLQNKTTLLQDHKSQFTQVWLPQLWFLILHPSKKYRSYCFQLLSLIEEAL